MIRKGLTVLGFMLSANGSVMAETPAEIFRRLDANHDGFLSGTEVKDYREGGSILGDQNNDAKLTLEELEGALDLADFKKMDKNQDGWLSGDENAGLAGYDLDGDGMITRDEFLTRRLQLRGKLKVQAAAVPGPFEIATRLKKTENGLAVAEADGGPATFPALAPVDQVNTATLAIGPDGTFHVLMMQDNGSKRALFYTSSPDAITWSKPEQMPMPANTIPRQYDYKMVLDAAGTPVVFYAAQGPQRSIPSDYFISSHSLFVRTIKSGHWSEPSLLGAEGCIFGWTPLVDARGAVAVVWCEYFPVIREGSKEPLYGSSSSLVRWAGLQGGVPVQVVELIKPNVDAPPRSYSAKADGYERPRGYVAQDGSLHLVLEKVKSITEKEQDCGLVYLTGNGPVRLLPFKAGVESARLRFPPSLQPGPAGCDYLITRTESPENFAVLCHKLVNGQIVGEPEKVFAADSEKGMLPYPGFAAFDGSLQGETLIGFPYKPQGTAIGQPSDCILLRSEGAGWSPGVDVTNGALRRKLVEESTLAGYKLPYPGVSNVSVAHGPKGERYALVLYAQNTISLLNSKTKYVSVADGQKPAFMILRWGN